MTAKPIAGKTILTDDHRCPHHNGVCDTQRAIASQTVTAKDGTANDGLQQIVGETHASEDAKVTENLANTCESIPGGDHRRDNHQQDKEIVDGRQPRRYRTIIDDAHHDDDDG